jgi:hypothetical protein
VVFAPLRRLRGNLLFFHVTPPRRDLCLPSVAKDQFAQLLPPSERAIDRRRVSSDIIYFA